MPNAANRIFGSTDGNFDRSAGPVDRISEGTYSQHTIYMPYNPPPELSVHTGRNYGFFNVQDVTLLAVEISF